MRTAVRLLTVPALAAIAALTAGIAYAQGEDEFVCNLRGFNVGPSSAVPIGRYLLVGAGVVAASFVGTRLFADKVSAGGNGAYARLNLLTSPLRRVIASPAPIAALKGAAVGLLMIILTAGIIGRSPLPATIVWLYFGAGVAILSALLGNIWMVINPWKTIYELLEQRFPQLQGAAQEWPEEYGVWPALALFAAYRWAELALPEPSDPETLAILIIVYSVVTLAAMWYFGKHTWLRFGDPFSVFFRLLSKLSPTEVRVRDCAECDVCDCCCDSDAEGCVDCYECFELADADQKEVNLRPFGAGLQRLHWPEPGEIAFVLFIFSSLAFAALRISRPWGDLADSLTLETTAQFVAFDSLGLFGLLAVAIVSYYLVASLLGLLTGSWEEGEDTAVGVVYALLPVAVAFMVAHYLRFLVMEGQLIIPIASDPFGLTWDLFGTASYRIDLDIPNSVHLWTLQIGSLFLGAFLSVYLIDRVVSRSLAGRWAVLRDQLPATALCGGYLLLSLWLLWAGTPSKDC